MTSRVTLYRVEGDVGPDFYCSMSGIDLTGRSISLTIRLEKGGEKNPDVVIDDAPNGQFHFELEPGDIVEGCHCLEWTFVSPLPGGKTQVVRFPKESTAVLIVRAQA